jgi:superfamily II RNA helicase
MITKNQALYLRTVKEINDLKRSSFLNFINKAEYNLNLIKLDSLEKNKERLRYRIPDTELRQVECIICQNSL